ncbi:hypothetical protein F4561_002706 [Lipingzhangella halophila]|uniref:Uncharacterized protein n=1 Tax=Lipingzhangella halophila TaxID=1783352 RepID=A0A7W7RI54_9ACTN|nr:hypothetical protein [Lipingzhangella halophila]MBB4931886.1 hypothetical protein [Lipingzhangella halophila]
MTHDEEPVAHPAAVTDLAADLAERRALDDTRRRHRRKRRWSRALHRIDLADLREQVATAAHERRERRESTHGDSALARLYRQASLAGERARISSQIKQSGEVRALRVQRVRVVSLAVLVPVLVAFAAWSTAGVHHGFMTLLDITAGTAMWVTGWGVEPALVTIVAGIIIVRAVLRSSGGDLGWRATVAEWVALSTSIALNMAGHWPDALSLATVAALVAHSIGPLGAAGTAWLIGIVDDAVSQAKPWDGARRLDEMELGQRGVSVSRPASGTGAVPLQASHGTAPELPGPVSPGLSHPGGPGRLTSHPAASQGETSRGTVPVSPTPETVRETPETAAPRPTAASETPGTASHETRDDGGETTEVVIPDFVPEEWDDRKRLVIATYEAARENGEPHSGGVISARTGVPKSTTCRYIKDYLAGE